MVLPPSSADPAHGQDWLGSVERALALARGSVMVLIAEARRERLPGLVRALLRARDDDVHVCMRAADLAALPLDATVLLQVRAEDATWLNINRPLFSSRRLRAILWADEQATLALRNHAPDFFDWISHVVSCPPAVPEFVVHGLTRARDVAPGIAWRGPLLADAVHRVEPDAPIQYISARASYGDIVHTAREPGWLVIDDVHSPHHLMRIRWALREARRTGRSIVRDARCDTPGFWPIDAHMTTWDDAVARLLARGVPSAPMLAALLGLEADALELLGSLVEHGVQAEELLAWAHTEDDPGAHLARVAWERGWLELGERVLAGDRPCVVRALAHEQAWRDARERIAKHVQSALEAWNGSAPLQVPASQAAVWAGAPGIEPPAPTDPRWEHTAAGYWLEALLARMTPESPRSAWDVLVDWAMSLQFADVALFWIDQHGLDSIRRARALKDLGDHEQAEEILRAAAAEIAAGTAPDEFQVHLDLANVLRKRGRYQEAEQVARQALAHVDDLPEHARFRSSCLEALADALQGQGQYEEAANHYRQALESAPSTARDSRALIAMGLALALMGLGENQEAETLLQSALGNIELGPDHPSYSVILTAYAAALTAQGHHARAETAAEQALACLHESLAPEHPAYTTALYHLARIQVARGKYQQAEQVLRQAWAIEEHALGAHHPNLIDTLRLLARTQEAQSKYGEAAELYARILDILEHTHGTSHATLVTTLTDLGHTLVILGNWDAAEAHLLRGLDIASRELGRDHASTARILTTLALLQAQTDPARARDTVRAALEALGSHSQNTPGTDTTAAVQWLREFEAQLDSNVPMPASGRAGERTKKRKQHKKRSKPRKKRRV